MQEKVGEQGRLISPCLKAGALRHILVICSMNSIGLISTSSKYLSVGMNFLKSDNFIITSLLFKFPSTRISSFRKCILKEILDDVKHFLT